MSAITVYSKPSCVQCTATYRAPDDKGIDYKVIDLSREPSALHFIKDLGYLQATVAVTPNQHWSGFRHDRIADIN